MDAWIRLREGEGGGGRREAGGGRREVGGGRWEGGEGRRVREVGRRSWVRLCKEREGRLGEGLKLCESGCDFRGGTLVGETFK